VGTRRDFLKLSGLGIAGGALAQIGCGRRHAIPEPGRAFAPTLTDVTGSRSLRAAAEAHGLLVGCAVDVQKLDAEQEYADIIAAQSNIVVAENAMKWKALRPSVDRFDFAPADDLVVYAALHNMKIRGHNLCWHEALPDWFASSVTRQNARQIFTHHIQTVAGRYAGRMHSWDVVNEAIDPRDGRLDGLRKTPWLDLIGADYVELAFRTARQADPTALLTYNDYAIELDTPEQQEKRAQVMLLVRRLKARGVPIDAVGVQSHLTFGDGAPGAGLRDFVRDLQKLGLQVFITELDVNDKKMGAGLAERDAGVAGLYRDYLNLMLAEPNVTALLTWGITDRYTWLNGAKFARSDGKPERPLPFDADYHPAPPFFAMREALNARGSGGSRAPGSPANPYAPFSPGTPKAQAAARLKSQGTPQTVVQ
jgi:endo-1,4-beta-xylanase